VSFPPPPAPATMAAGWYPDPQGVPRYWDGQRWLDIPAPPAMQREPEVKKPWHRRVGPWIAICSGVIAVIAAAIFAFVMLQQARAEEERAVAEAAEAASEAAEARRVEALEESRQDSERQQRAAMIPEIEAAIATMAEEHIADGMIDGAVLDVGCTPVDRYSLDDLTQPSAVLECFVGTEDVGDGMMRGYDYNATVDWETGRYSYGFGSP
jgi:type II secretory pathway pseudopilin PulG